MGRLVLAHEQERLRLVAVLQPFDRQLANDVGGVALMLDALAILDHWRVIVDALAGEDVPMIETGRIAPQVPFADDRRRITGRLQQFGKRGLSAVEPGIRVVVKPVAM